MKKTKHAEIRSQQRGVSQEQIDLILSFGKKTRRPGGGWEYRIKKKQKTTAISELKRRIRLIEKSADKGVLVNQNLDTIITVYHIL